MRLSGRVSRGIRALVITRWIYRATVCANREKVEALSSRGSGISGEEGRRVRANSTLIRGGLIVVPDYRNIGTMMIVLSREA